MISRSELHGARHGVLGEMVQKCTTFVRNGARLVPIAALGKDYSISDQEAAHAPSDQLGVHPSSLLLNPEGEYMPLSERTRVVPAQDENAAGQAASLQDHPALAARMEAVRPSKPIDLSFAVWLSRQLRRQRISQRELARRGGLDHSTISRLLVGGRAPNWSTVQRIAQVVGFPPPSVLFGGLMTRGIADDERRARSQRRDGR